MDKLILLLYNMYCSQLHRTKKKIYMTLEGKIHYDLIRIHIRSQLCRLSYKLKFRYVS